MTPLWFVMASYLILGLAAIGACYLFGFTPRPWPIMAWCAVQGVVMSAVIWWSEKTQADKDKAV